MTTLYSKAIHAYLVNQGHSSAYNLQLKMWSAGKDRSEKEKWTWPAV